MKKLMFFFCSLGVLISCSNVSDGLQKDDVKMPFEVNEAVAGSIPLRLRIAGGSPASRALAASPNETTIANVSVELKCWGGESTQEPLFEETYMAGSDTDLLVNVPVCDSVDVNVQTGAYEDGKYLTSIEGQTEHFYASGTLRLTWEQMQNQELPFEVVLTRLINKITIKKITLDWTNPTLASREFRVKKIYLSDVLQQYIENCSNLNVYGYSEVYTGSPKGALFNNFAGLGEYTAEYQGHKFAMPVSRVDRMLVDELDALVSQDTPYTTPHVFYAYICNSSNIVPKPYVYDVNEGTFKVYPAMTTIVVEAELDGNKMFYRFPVYQPGVSAPKNTHLIFNELKITEAGSATLLGSKTYETFTYSFTDWTDDVITDSVESF